MMYFTVQEGEEERTLSGKFSPDGNTLTLDGGYCEDQSQPIVLAKCATSAANRAPARPARRQGDSKVRDRSCQGVAFHPIW